MGQLISLRKSPEGRPEVHIIVGMGNDGPEIEIMTDNKQYTFKIDNADFENLMESARTVTFSPVFKSHNAFCGIGVGYELKLGCYDAPVQFSWAMDAPKGWGNIEDIANKMYLFSHHVKVAGEP
jgi:hypothetical protein